MIFLHHLALWGFALACAISTISLIACSSTQSRSGSPRVLTSIAVTPPAPLIAKGSRQQFTATGSFSDGSMQNITTTALWASSDTSVATIQSSTGLATGVGPGSSQITASLNGIVSPTAALTVTASGAMPALVQHVSGSNTRNNGFSSPFCYHYQLPNPTTAGNSVVVGFTFNGNPTPSVTDDKNNIYTIEANHFDSVNTQSIAIAAAFNVAAGARLIDLCFSFNPGGFVQPMATEFANVTAIDGAGTGAHGVGNSVSAGTMTPSASSDLIYQVVSSILVNQSSFTAGLQSNITWNLLSADLMDGFAAQYGVYNSTAAINPSIGMGTSQKWVSAAVLLKAGTSGGAPSGMRIVHLIHENIPTHASAGGSDSPFPNPLSLQLPTSGNLLVAMIGGGNPTNTVSSIADTNKNVWMQAGSTQVIAGNDTVQAYFAANATTSPNLALTLNWSSSGGDFTIFFYDVIGAASSPLDIAVGNTGTQSTAGNLTVPFSITPTTANELIFVQTIWDFNTGVGLAGSGQLFDADTFDGESQSGPEPVDENNGWGHVPNASIAKVSFTWVPKFGGLAFGNWSGMAVAFKAAP
jgi:hypothetical protein